jgi:endonuclease/exonuclease/phosphatase family metal-dependent hydrolase
VGNNIHDGLLREIKDANADVVVLNEYTDALDKGLLTMGYTIHIGTVDYPTALATRLNVSQHKEIILSDDRSAILAQVHTKAKDNDDEMLWVIGTHVNFMNGQLRQQEMQVLVEKLDKMGLVISGTSSGNKKERIVLMGDLNQQREQDYSEDEWDRIHSGMIYRRSSVDDGVATMLLERGFVCAWDAHPSPDTNWETKYPPATHWTGTIVDYSYSYGDVLPLAVSILPTVLSDHRMTICDWTW